ncbi:MAG: sugar ABC transporter substrate-binding protein, partial [Clostridiales bacterium]|nr:sugar ABC transporter substrate-binding protein [Clostridiales bacterium]
EINIEDEGKYQADLNQLYLKGLAKLIKCSPYEFDGEYDRLLSEYLNSGGQQIIDQKKAIYDTMRYR